jgi:hypothetical protein
MIPEDICVDLNPLESDCGQSPLSAVEVYKD